MAVSDTLRGYRTQFLYTLHRIAKEKDPICVYRPEGIEDLDIIKQGCYIETIQVKNYRSGCIGLSDLSSKGNKTSFFSRGIDVLKRSSGARLKLVSYGAVDKSLSDRNRLLQSLKKQFNKDEAKDLVQHFDIEFVDEDSLYKELNAYIKEAFVNANPEKEITYLVQWISECAELHKEVTYEDFVRQLTCYEAFLNRQLHCVDELGTRIKPLFAEPMNNIDKNLLEKDFYQGVSVSDKHIWAGLGVSRIDKELAIKGSFQDSPIVVIHGMSGQGKSCLCYQFIKKNYPVAFEIANCDSSSFCHVCASIEEMVAGLQVPILLYMDVAPSNSEWLSLLNSFANFKNVRLLVSIREDDWNQHRAKLNTHVSFKDIHLELTETEAKKIYEVLDVKGVIKGDVDFNEIWNLFSSTGALLEFVYYLTHGQKLKDRIIAQWNDLSNDDKRLVSYVTIANYLGGRLKRTELVSFNDINVCILQGQIQRLSGEFFCCDDDGILDNIHPLRTKLLKDAIFENATDLFFYEALKLYTICDVEEPYLYLIRLMHEGVQVSDFLSYMMRVKNLSCSQLFGVVKALIWKGAEEYEKNNHALMIQLRHEMRAGWALFLPINFSEVDVNSSLEKLLGDNHNFKSTKEIINRFTEQTDVYVYIHQYLSNSNLTLSPKSWRDWWYASQIAYWTNCANLSSHISYCGEINVISNDIDELSTVLLGLKSAHVVIGGLEQVETEFVERLRRDFLVISWSCADSIEAIVATNYIETSDNSKSDDKPNNYLVHLLNLCRRAFPEKELYCAKFATDLILSSMDVPDVEKRIPRAYLPLQEMHEIRSVVTNLFTMSYRLTNRKDYANEVFCKRKKWVTQVGRLCKSFESWWLKGKDGLKTLSKEYDAFNVFWNGEIEQPKSSYNTWGYGGANVIRTGEIESKELIEEGEDSLGKFHHIMNQHFVALKNFLSQSIDVLTKSENLAPANSNLIDLLENLSIFQTKYREVFAIYIGESELNVLEKNEQNNYLLLWLIWDIQMKGITERISIKSIHSRYEQMSSNLINVVSSKIKRKIEDANFTCETNVEEGKLNIEIDYSSEQEYFYLQDVAIHSIIDILGKYAYFSTQRLILKKVFDKIVIKPYYKSFDGKRFMLEDQLIEYNLLSCLDRDVLKDENDFPTPFPCLVERKKLGRYLDSYIDLRSFIGNGYFVCTQLIEMFNSTHEEDECGQKIVKEYLQKCEKQLLSLAHIDDWGTIKECFSNTEYDSDIEHALNMVSRFYSEIQKSESWYDMGSVLNQTLQRLHNYNVGIKIFLVEKGHNYA